MVPLNRVDQCQSSTYLDHSVHASTRRVIKEEFPFATPPAVARFGSVTHVGHKDGDLA